MRCKVRAVDTGRVSQAPAVSMNSHMKEEGTLKHPVRSGKVVKMVVRS